MTDNRFRFRADFFDSLGEASQWLRLFDFVPNLYLYVKDTDGRFVAMNEALARLRGAKSQDELIGKTDVDLHQIYWGNLYLQEDLRVIRSDREVRDQVWLVPVESGELRSFVSSKIPLRDRNGQCIGIAGVMYPLESENQKNLRTKEGLLDLCDVGLQIRCFSIHRFSTFHSAYTPAMVAPPKPRAKQDFHFG